MSKCVLCETRKPRRHCMAVNGDICSQCCGTSREVTVVCPFECGYLREARIHEKLVDVDPQTFPHQDVKITERFLVDHEDLLLATASALAEGALEANHAYDSDVKEAIEALIKTYRTLIAGVFYEALPNNSVAASIQDIFSVGLWPINAARPGGISIDSGRSCVAPPTVM